MDAANKQIKTHVERIRRPGMHATPALAALLHLDTVWPWSSNATAHDPMQWLTPLWRYDRERWIRKWPELFDSHDLVHNWRRTLHVMVFEAHLTRGDDRALFSLAESST